MLPLVLEANAELGARIRGVAIDEDVRRGEQTPEHVLASGGPQIDRHAALVPVDLHVGGAVTGSDLTEEVTQVVTTLRTLDLDHIGTEVTEVGTDGVAVEQHRRLDHPDTGQ